MGYRIFDHTADLGVIVTAATREGLYAAAVEALFDCLADRAAIREMDEREVAVSGADPADLLVNLLREALYLWSGEAFLVKHGRVEAAGPRELRARLTGEAFDPARHRIKQEIKAVTYHQAEVRQDETGGWRARVIFDV